ncbi:MAG: UvrD-helicase domain-containing protein, partial [Oscillospiraceae bacterium]|nr:UvrD-helicase domain-containing protein [Oscillospiraceae bacterium]
AAAAELRGRVLAALSERLSRRPNEPHLRRQLTRLSACDICTVHALCKRLLTENAASGGLRPGARLLTDADRALLMNRVLDEVLEASYAAGTEDGLFSALVAATADGGGDGLLVGLVMTVFEKTRGHADPEGWMAAQETAFAEAAAQSAGTTVWGRALLDAARRMTAYALDGLRRARGEMAAAPPVEKGYGPAFDADIDQAEALLAALKEGWEPARARARDIVFVPLRAAKGFEDQAFLGRCKAARAAWKEKRAPLLKKLLEGSSEAHGADAAALTPVVRGLFQTVRRFSQALDAEKQRLNVFDFNDLERRALALLEGPDGVGGRMAGQYDEVMVDEYQDISRIQERLVQALSRGGRNLFLVGDVRQSIYRFRLAEPALFLEKYNTYPDEASDGQPRRVLLGDNFRSRPEVLDAVNALFADIMSPETGEMAYTQREYLRAAAGGGPEPDRRCELVLAQRPPEGEAESELGEGADSLSRVQVEAAVLAKRLRALLDSPFSVTEKDGTRRPIRSGDIALLLRAPSTRAAAFARALADVGIPCYVGGDADFFRAPEVLTALSLLRVIDNPRQDVALLAALRCPAFGVDAEGLARARTACPDGDALDMVTQAAAEGDKAAGRFLDMLGRWRILAPDLTASQLLLRVYEDARLMARYGAQADGAARQRALTELVDLAGRFEAGRYQGLFAFLRWIDALRAGGQKSGQTDAPPDAVALMSIHRSKGLEFPVVVVAGAAGRFNEADTRAPLLFHPDMGLGLTRRDDGRMIEYPTLSRRAVARRLTDEMLAEEMRMLYVAMTRAREKLIVLAAPVSPEEALTKWEAPEAGPLPPQMVSEGRSYLDWLGMHLGRQLETEGAPGEGTVRGLWEVSIVAAASPARVLEAGQAVAAPSVSPPDPALVTELTRRLGYVYPYAEAALLPSKLTATALKGRGLDEEAASEAGREIGADIRL